MVPWPPCFFFLTWFYSKLTVNICSRVWRLRYGHSQYVTFLLLQTFLSVPFPLVLFLPPPSALQRVTTARLVWDLHAIWLPWDLLLGRRAAVPCSCWEPRRQKQFGDHCQQWSWQTPSRSLWTVGSHLSGERWEFRLPTRSLTLEVDEGLSQEKSPGAILGAWVHALERGTCWLPPPLWAQVEEAP